MPLLKKDVEKNLKSISINPHFTLQVFKDIENYLNFSKLSLNEFFQKAGEFFTTKNNLKDLKNFDQKITFKFDEDLANHIEGKNIPFDIHFKNAALFILSKDKEFKTWKKEKSA